MAGPDKTKLVAIVDDDDSVRNALHGHGETVYVVAQLLVHR
jgi:hypothetical protein